MTGIDDRFYSLLFSTFYAEKYLISTWLQYVYFLSNFYKFAFVLSGKLPFLTTVHYWFILTIWQFWRGLVKKLAVKSLFLLFLYCIFLLARTWRLSLLHLLLFSGCWNLGSSNYLASARLARIGILPAACTFKG